MVHGEPGVESGRNRLRTDRSLLLWSLSLIYVLKSSAVLLWHSSSSLRERLLEQLDCGLELRDDGIQVAVVEAI